MPLATTSKSLASQHRASKRTEVFSGRRCQADDDGSVMARCRDAVKACGLAHVIEGQLRGWAAILLIDLSADWTHRVPTPSHFVFYARGPGRRPTARQRHLENDQME